jgi:hypothetical protein
MALSSSNPRNLRASGTFKCHLLDLPSLPVDLKPSNPPLSACVDLVNSCLGVIFDLKANTNAQEDRKSLTADRKR